MKINATRVLAASAVVMALAGVAQTIRAQEAPPAFGGITLASTGTALSWSYNQPSAGIPASPTGELNSVYSEAKLSQDNSYGLASLLWPGQVAANAPALIWNTFFIEMTRPGRCPEQYCGKPDLEDPTYPVRAETFYPQGPEDQATEPFAGSRMRSSAKAAKAEASSAADESGFPAVISVGTQTSSVQDTVADGLAVAQGDAAVSDVSILGGLIKIGSVVTTATAQTDGRQGKVAGNVIVSGLVIDGYPMQLDSSGLRDGDQTHGAEYAILRQQVQQALAQAGVKMNVAGPIDSIEGPSAMRSVGGLVITFAADVLRPYVAQMPAQIRDQVEANVALDNTISVSLAAVAVQAAASSPEAIGGFDDGSSDEALDTFTGGELEPSGAVLGESFEAPADTGTATGDASAPTTSVRRSEGGRLSAAPASAPISTSGISFWLIAAALAAAAFVARYLARAADGALLAGAAAGAPCPLERVEDDTT